MTVKELRELITINIEPIDYVTIVASNEDVEYKMNYGWSGMGFRVLIISSVSSNINYTTQSVQPIFRHFIEIINHNNLEINYTTYILNMELGIYILNFYEGKDVAYTFETQMDKIYTLNVRFCPVKEIINYAEASINFNNFINSLKTKYDDYKIDICSLTPKGLCREKKIQKLFNDE
ncbi:MAG TPA: hypothetical protein PLH91_08315 [Tenuifilaceae bacterium]|nr:hypothetical protein [Tenuifilaceae bacterium]HPI45221.1 hypothetical protein [Tenuifilaceae bacterium]